MKTTVKKALSRLKPRLPRRRDHTSVAISWQSDDRLRAVAVRLGGVAKKHLADEAICLGLDVIEAALNEAPAREEQSHEARTDRR